MKCTCGSYAINHHLHGRDGTRGGLCDVCFWREKASQRDALLAALEGLVQFADETKAAYGLPDFSKKLRVWAEARVAIAGAK